MLAAGHFLHCPSQIKISSVYNLLLISKEALIIARL